MRERPASVDETSDDMITRNKRGGGTEEVRPGFAWPPQNEQGDHILMSCVGQLAEDSRNILEEIRGKQMLQCDVRSDIATIAREVGRMRRVLEEAFGRKKRKRKKAAAKGGD
jgi:hydrogenase maturation factor